MTWQNRAHFYGIAARLTRRILADNVKCSHGATSGQLSEDIMFYLLSRGIPAPVAKQLLVSGFLNEVVDRLDYNEITDFVHKLIEAKFARR